MRLPEPIMISEDQQRTVLQFLLVERMMTYNDFTETICRVVGHSDLQVDTLIENLNDKIRRFSQNIVTTNSEITGEKWVVLASTADNAEIKSTLSKDQLDFFYHLMDGILINQGSISSTYAINAAPLQTGGRITMSEGEKLLNSFVQKKLLVLENGLLFLSPLTIVELSSFIVDKYSPGNCLLCKKIVILGVPCPHCDAPVHSPCSQAYVSNKKQVRCPQCKGDWAVGRQ